MAYVSKDIQGTTPFVAPKGKRTSEQIAQADADLRVMQATKGYREVKVLDMDGTGGVDDRMDGGPAPLPKGAK
jgi:hypothetical protein